MSGRELIIYILENGLEDVDVFDVKFFKEFPTVGDVAVAFNVGTATVEAWLENGCLVGIEFDGVVYISPASLNKLAEKKAKEVANV